MKKRLLFSGALLFCSLATALPARAATFSVTSPADSGAGSLRDALAQANANADADTITFNLPPGTQSITLSSGALFIYNNVSIIGPGAGALRVDGNGAINNSVFGVSSIGSSNANPSLTASISGLTITGGTGNPARLWIPMPPLAAASSTGTPL